MHASAVAAAVASACPSPAVSTAARATSAIPAASVAATAKPAVSASAVASSASASAVAAASAASSAVASSAIAASAWPAASTASPAAPVRRDGGRVPSERSCGRGVHGRGDRLGGRALLPCGRLLWRVDLRVEHAVCERDRRQLGDVRRGVSRVPRAGHAPVHGVGGEQLLR